MDGSENEPFYSSPQHELYAKSTKSSQSQMATVDVFQSVFPLNHGLPPLLPPPKPFKSKGSPYIPGTSLPLFLPPPQNMFSKSEGDDVPPPLPPRAYSVNESGEPLTSKERMKLSASKRDIKNHDPEPVPSTSSPSQVGVNNLI